MLVLLTVPTLNVAAQTAQLKLDSLLAVDKSYRKEDSTKFVIKKNIFIQYGRLKNDQKLEEAATKALTLAKQLNKPALEGGIYYRLGLYYHGSNRYLKAESNYFKSIEKYTLINDLDWVAGNYQNLGALYTIIPDYAKALEANQKAISIYQKLDDESSFADIYTNIGVLYQYLGQYSKSLTYLNRSLKEYLKEGENNRGVGVVYEAIGTVYISASDEELKKMGVNSDQKNDLSLINFNKALLVAKAIDDKRLSAGLYGKIGLIYEKKGEDDKALESYKKSIELNSLESSSKNYAYSLIALAKFYYYRNDFNKSKPLLIKALQIGEKGNQADVQRDAYEYLSLNEERLTNYNASLTNYKKYILLRDQIFDQEKEKEITRKRLQLDFSIKEKDYQYQQRLTNSELKTQLLIAKQQQQELILRQQQLALSDKEKSLQRLTFLKKQADLENEKQYQTNLLKQQELSAKLDKELKDKKIILQQIEIKFNQKLSTFLGFLALILFGIAIFVYYIKRKTAQLNKVVSEQKTELEKLGKVKDRIFSVVGHDMRSPVNSLISFIQLLEDGNMEQQKLNKYAGHLKNTLTYTSAMMENLLNWASSQMQGFKPVIENFDIQLCVDEVVNALKEIAQQKNIRIENNIEPGKLCLADMNMTKLVLRNLIGNAIKFTREMGVIKISVTENTDQMFIAVSDTGVGLSPIQIEKFNLLGFDESGKTTLGTNKEKGTGIGLMLCRTFTALMKGSLQVQSQENVGSVFTLILPKAA